VAMSDEDEGEDEVNTQKKAPVKEVKKKKVAKEAKKKKVAKKVTKKKANKKKKGVSKVVVENIKKTVKNGKVKYETTGLFGVVRGNISFRAKKKPIETGPEEFCYLDHKKLGKIIAKKNFFPYINLNYIYISRSIKYFCRKKFSSLSKMMAL